jgi:hypothetical protein
MFQIKVIRKIKTPILCSKTFFRKSFGLWENIENYRGDEEATDDNIIRRMHFACWINKSTDTRWAYLIVTAFPRQPCFFEGASVLRHTCIAFLVEVWTVKMYLSYTKWRIAMCSSEIDIIF